MVDFVNKICSENFKIQYLNIGGGFGIDYYYKGIIFFMLKDFIDIVWEFVIKEGLIFIIEFGRLLVVNILVFVSNVIGVKMNGMKDFIVIDGSMLELIWLSLYGVYQYIEFVVFLVEGVEVKFFDVVGLVCEFVDFLGKECELLILKCGDGFVVYDVGVYCMVMVLIYNLWMRFFEYWVMEDGKIVEKIRYVEQLDDYICYFEGL